MINITYFSQKITLSKLSTYSELVNAISQTFNIPSQSFYITYVDEDQDSIHVSNEEDIVAMLETSTSTIQMTVNDLTQQFNQSVIEEVSPEKNQKVDDEKIEEMVKNNVENYFIEMEKVWKPPLEIANKPEEENKTDLNDFLNGSMEMVESREIDLMEVPEVPIELPTKAIQQTQSIEKIVDERIYKMLPLITSIVETNLSKNAPLQATSASKTLELALRLKHKRINRLIENYPSIPIIQITQIVDDTLDLQFEDLQCKLNESFPRQGR